MTDRLMRLTGHRILNIGFILSVLCVLAVSTISAVSLRYMITGSAWVDHTNAVLERIDAVFELVQDIETGHRGYLITGNSNFLSPYVQGKSMVMAELEAIARLVADNPSQQEQVLSLEPLILAKIGFSQHSIDLKAKGHADEAIQVVADGDGALLMEQIRATVKNIKATEKKLLAERDTRREYSTKWTIFFITLGGIMSCCILWLAKRSISRDLAARVQAERALHISEERFQVVARATQDAVWDWDLGQDSVWWNEGLASIFGYGKNDVEYTGGWWVNGIHPGDREKVIHDIHELLDNPQLNHWNGEYRFRRKDGSYATVLDRGFVIRDPQGKANRMIGSLLDITERKSLELNLTRASEEALEVSRLKSEFLANMSHEIRTPMNGVIGMTGLLLDTEMTADQREFAETIRGCADGLLTIINDILDFSKIEAGKLEIEILEFDLRSAIEGCTDLMAHTAHAKNLELAAFIDPAMPRFLRGDAGRIRQIIMNLLGNALKFTQSGEVILSVRCESQTADAAVVRFEVKDTGIGISPANCTRIFEAFSQADGSTVRKYGGTGLGLTISRQLVTLMQGEIGVESQVGKGSSFWFTLPVEIAKGTVDPLSTDLPDLKGLRVLVLDDNATNQRIVHHQVVSWGMRNGSPRSPQEALDLLRQESNKGDPYDLAILDMQMPGMNGIELARLIKSDSLIASTKLILMTSAAEVGHAEELKAAGFVAWMTKPVKQAQLLECLKQIMARPIGSKPETPRRVVDNRPVLISSIRILVAEDNMINQKIALTQLQKLGYRADAVANGLEALEAIRNRPYDLVLMDCQMPEMDGYEATRQIRALKGPERSVTIIAMTANAMEGDRERCLNAGMNDHISKPVKIDLLSGALTRWTQLDKKPA